MTADAKPFEDFPTKGDGSVPTTPGPHTDGPLTRSGYGIENGVPLGGNALRARRDGNARWKFFPGAQSRLQAATKRALGGRIAPHGVPTTPPGPDPDPDPGAREVAMVNGATLAHQTGDQRYVYDQDYGYLRADNGGDHALLTVTGLAAGKRYTMAEAGGATAILLAFVHEVTAVASDSAFAGVVLPGDLMPFTTFSTASIDGNSRPYAEGYDPTLAQSQVDMFASSFGITVEPRAKGAVFAVGLSFTVAVTDAA